MLSVNMDEETRKRISYTVSRNGAQSGIAESHPIKKDKKCIVLFRSSNYGCENIVG